jgi:hypothetical protein
MGTAAGERGLTISERARDAAVTPRAGLDAA